MQNAPKLFVAVGEQGQRLTSPDGSAWKPAQLGKEGEVYRAVRFGNGRYVAVGSYGGNNILASTADGENWQTGTKDAQYSKYVRGLAFGNGTFLALGGDPGSVGVSNPFVLTSADGVAWGDYTPIEGKNILRRAAFGNDAFVAVGDRGRRAASKDGRSWTDAPEAKAIDTLIDVAFGNGVFVGVGLHGLRVSSRDGLKWSAPVRGEEGEHLNAVVFTGDRFAAVGAGATYFSPDGEHWERRPNKDAPLTVAFGANTFVGAHWKGRLFASNDAVDWRQVHRCEHHVEAIAYGG